MSRDRSKDSEGQKRSYPGFWEHAVPVLVALIAVIIVGLLVVAMLVALGFISG